jgi:hypothetical protein
MTDLIQLRKIAMQFEEIYHEGGPPPAQPQFSRSPAIPMPAAMSRT